MIALPRVSGVYKIICIKTGKFYVGSSKDIRHRQIQHLCHLRKGGHHCIYLQRTWNKYGEDNFIFEVYKACDNYQEEEKGVLDNLFDSGQLFNTSKQVSGGDLISYHPNRDDIRDRMTKSIHKKIDSMTEEERKDKWGRPGELNGMYGKHHSDDAKEKVSKAHLGNHWAKGSIRSNAQRKVMSDFAKTRTGEKNPFYGKTHSDESKAKMREKRLGKKSGNICYYLIEGKYFEGLTEASKALGVHITVISYRVNSKTYENYKKVTKEEYLANKEE